MAQKERRITYACPDCHVMVWSETNAVGKAVGLIRESDGTPHTCVNLRTVSVDKQTKSE